jgi:hypothetical protein
MTWKLHKLIGSLAKDRRGAALLYVSMLLPVLIGGGLLAIDASRLFNLQTSLQEGADALALAGAAELDRRPAFGGAPSSIDRATNAINNLVQNQSVFMHNARFFSNPPASDYDTKFDSEAIIPSEAQRFELPLIPAKVVTIFPQTCLGRAVAVVSLEVAGLPTTLCDPAANPNSHRLEIIFKKQGDTTAQNGRSNLLSTWGA